MYKVSYFNLSVVKRYCFAARITKGCYTIRREEIHIHAIDVLLS